MKWPLRSHPSSAVLALLAILGVSCTTTTNTTVVNLLMPTITRLSPDTVWTFRTDTIYGTNFGYDANDVRASIDTTRVQINSIDDTMMTVYVPETAHTSFVHVRAYEQTGTSPERLFVNYTFYPHPIADSVPIGGSFSISGTGMNNYHGTLRLTLNGMALPIDSMFPDRIVSHVPPNSYSGTLAIYDSSGSYSGGSLIVTRPSVWTTLSEIWDNVTVIEQHTLSGYRNGPANPIDSTWRTTVTYSGQHDLSVSGTMFEKTVQGLNYAVFQPNYYYPLLQIVWDTVSQTAQVVFQKYTSIPATPYHSLDTSWYNNSNNGQILTALLPVDRDIEFILSNVGYTINEDSTDAAGLVNWRETTTITATSGSFDIILKK